MEAVGELDQDDPDVRGHRDHHLPVVLRLVLVAALERDPGQLRHAVDQPGDGVAEELAHLIEARRRVLDRVVEQRRAEGLGVEPQPGADLGDLDRVGDEVLAGTPALVRMALAGERERLLDGAPVELRGPPVGVLGDDGEQVAEERPLVVGQALRVLVVGDLDGRGVLVRPTRVCPPGSGVSVSDSSATKSPFCPSPSTPLPASGSSSVLCPWSGIGRTPRGPSDWRRSSGDRPSSPRTEDTASSVRCTAGPASTRTTPISARTRSARARTLRATCRLARGRQAGAQARQVMRATAPCSPAHDRHVRAPCGPGRPSVQRPDGERSPRGAASTCSVTAPVLPAAPARAPRAPAAAPGRRSRRA